MHSVTDSYGQWTTVVVHQAGCDGGSLRAVASEMSWAASRQFGESRRRAFRVCFIICRYFRTSSHRGTVAGANHRQADRIRPRRRQAEGDFDPFDKNGHWKARVSKWHGDPREIAENIEFRKVLASCLSKLPPQIAEVFCLFEVESMSSKELCKELEISATNVWTMLHRARCRARALVFSELSRLLARTQVQGSGIMSDMLKRN
jgi:RNA polymerase sigma factor (sigma-70 family)